MKGKRTAIIEAPFLEPGMPYPETFQWCASLCAQGVDAVALDLNAVLYRAIIEDNTPITDADQLLSCVGRASFMDERQLLGRIGGGGFVTESLEGLDQLRRQAVALFSGSAQNLTHADYVNGAAIINGFLDYRVKQIDGSLSLWLEAFLHPIAAGDAESILAEASRADGGLQRLFDRYLVQFLERTDFVQAFVAIRCEEQLLPGLALAHWLRHNLHTRVAVGGRYLESVLALRMPAQIFDVCDNVVLGPLSGNLAHWAANGCERHFYRETCESLPDLWLHHGLAGVGAKSKIYSDMAQYLSPIKVAGVLATSRCYWSRCAFCAIACEQVQPFRHASPSDFAARLCELDLGDEVRHLQFLDYALPPSLLNGAAKLCGSLELRWAAQLRFDHALRRSGRFAGLHRIGCRAVAWGFESGSSNVLLKMRKGGGLPPESRTEILRESALAGISNHLFVIVGYPGESDSDFAATLDFIARNLDHIHSVEVHAYQPITGTPACQALEAEGAVVSMGDWSPRRAYRDKRLEVVASERKAIVSEIALCLGGLHRTSDLLEGHMSFQYLWRRGADK